MVLKVVQTKTASSKNLRVDRKEAAAAKYEALWQADPEQFNPLDSAEGRARIQHSWSLIKHLVNPNISCADLGCGYGILSHQCAESGARVTAVDIAQTALQRLQDIAQLSTEKHYIPHTTLSDGSYDLVIAAEVIAELPADEYRLFFSELARLVKPEGKLLVSTALDIDSEGPLERFLKLAHTEIEIDQLHYSYHRLFIRLSRFLKATKILSPLARYLSNSDRGLRWMEQLTEFLYEREGVSHVIILGKRRPLYAPLPENQQPQERKVKKRIWE